MSDPSSNVRADARLKQLVLRDEQAEEDLWAFRHPDDPEGTPLTYSAIRVQIPLRYGFTISHASLLEFYRWLELKRQYDHAADTERQAMEEMAKNPDISEEDMKAAGRRIFRAAVMNKLDVKAFVAMEMVDVMKDRAQLARERLDFDKDKLSHASRSKIEAGLDALLAEIKGNPKAVELFNQLKLEVKKK